MNYNKGDTITVYLRGGHVFTGVLTEDNSWADDTHIHLNAGNYKYGESDARTEVGTVRIARNEICAISALSKK